MEQLVILLIIGLISLVNWILQKAAEKREAAQMKREAALGERREARRNIYTERAPVPEVRPAQDPFKELMDALGLPAEEAPPPLVRRAMEPEIFEDEEFASLEEPAPPPVPVVVRAPSWQATKRPTQPDRKTRELASAFAGAERTDEPAWSASGLRQMLSGRSAQRQAVVLTEILGTPRGLAPAGALMTRGHL
jgi:hypothetical protein